MSKRFLDRKNTPYKEKVKCQINPMIKTKRSNFIIYIIYTSLKNGLLLGKRKNKYIGLKYLIIQ